MEAESNSCRTHCSTIKAGEPVCPAASAHTAVTRPTHGLIKCPLIEGSDLSPCSTRLRPFRNICQCNSELPLPGTLSRSFPAQVARVFCCFSAYDLVRFLAVSSLPLLPKWRVYVMQTHLVAVADLGLTDVYCALRT